jgi:putative FmdB family regulatory protein
MPLYEYRCHQCEKVFEYQQRMADPAKTTCEECAGALERLISRSSFSFKGGGWYKDLYSSAKPSATPQAASNDGAAPPSGASSTATPPAASSTTSSSDAGSGGGSSSAAAAAAAK